jgi:hypothetical protein
MSTGTIIAASEFPLPGNVGGSRKNRDCTPSFVITAFTPYVYLETASNEKADAYVRSIFDRIRPHAELYADATCTRPSSL